MKQFALLLAVIITVSVVPVTAKAATTTDQPLVVITGRGVTGKNYTEKNIGNEVAYSLEELKALAETDKNAKNSYLYSTVNKAGTKGISKGEGIRLNALLLESGINGSTYKSEISVIASDGFRVSFTPNTKRYYYPKIATGKAKGKKIVSTILAWGEAVSKEEVKVPGKTEKLDYLKMMAGQVNVKDINNSLFNKYVQSVQVGKETTKSILTIQDRGFLRSTLLLMPRTTMDHSYTNSAGEVSKSKVRGVALADLLSVYKEDAVVRFTTADDYKVDASGKTVGELKKEGYILAYEEFNEESSSFEAIYSTAKDNEKMVGYLTLYADGSKGAKMINKIMIEE